jgi:diphosphomevalonate decarboxylase
MTEQPLANKNSGRVGWQSPSNIAIVKYWGKRDNQLPMNPSLSMTLDKAVTQTTIDYRCKASGDSVYSFKFHDKPNVSFSPKLDAFFRHLVAKYPLLGDYHFDIHSQNSFPHSAGIASSASAMSALALCAEEIAHVVMGKSTFHPIDASELARLGSGSAVRSLHPRWAVWGETSVVAGTSDHVAVPLQKVHPVFNTFCDAILLVDEGEKSVSSSAGHQLMANHPYQQGRLSQAHFNVERLTEAIATGNLSTFIDVCEEEALSLHALMMSSVPGYLLMHPNTVKIIGLVRSFRQSTGIPVAFTLDAGPNVHLLYPHEHHAAIEKWINGTLRPLTATGNVIFDGIGSGPTRLVV